MERDRILSGLLYLGCVLIGALVGFFAVDLQPSIIEKPVVDVRVAVPDSVVIHDAITGTEVKYEYVNKTRCCCENCKKGTPR